MASRKQKAVKQEVAAPLSKVPKPAPVSVVPRVTLQVFTKVSGLRQSQLAGFVRRMQGQAPAKRTVADWHKAYDDFTNRPVAG